MSDRVRRYNFGVSWTDVSTREPSNQDWVSWRDYRELEAENARLLRIEKAARQGIFERNFFLIEDSLEEDSDE